MGAVASCCRRRKTQQEIDDEEFFGPAPCAPLFDRDGYPINRRKQRIQQTYSGEFEPTR